MQQHHFDRVAAGLTLAAQGVLEASGEQWTELRSAVFAALAARDRPASAYDIAAALTDQLGRRIAANSVYRILDLFVAARLATRVESRNAYLVNTHPGCPHDCIFLVCDACGEATHLDDDGLAGRLREVAVARGFAPSRPVIEVAGRCGGCAAAAT